MRLVAMLAMSLLPSLAAEAETRAVVVAGLGGAPEYEAAFERQARRSADRLGTVADDVTLLLGEQASRKRLAAALAALAERTARDDALVWMFIGHGSFDERVFRFNVPGPDFTGAELSAWLARAPAARQLVIVAASASGAVHEPLAAQGRTVITSTKSGGERNAGVFARYFTAALGDATADTDKDRRVTAAEAFRFANDKVEAHYAAEDQMVTEHPRAEGPEAALALARLEPAPDFAPGLAPLLQRRDELTAAIAALRADKNDREVDAYYAELERLLLELAVVEQTLAGEGAPP